MSGQGAARHPETRQLETKRLEPELLVLVGLTGAGKSTTLAALACARTALRLLPDRRELADRVVIPEAQRLDGLSIVPVTDRLERFRLTARYRGAHGGGLAHALATLLPSLLPSLLPAQLEATTFPTLVFDNLRGVDEVAFAVAAFPAARFVVLECDAATRVARLAGRADAFDRVGPVASDALPAAGRPAAGNASPQPSANLIAGEPTRPDRPVGTSAARVVELRARLLNVPGLAGLLDVTALAAALQGLDPNSVDTAARVVAEESLHYDPAAAWAVLAPLPSDRRLRLDTGRLRPESVVAAVHAWL